MTGHPDCKKCKKFKHKPVCRWCEVIRTVAVIIACVVNVITLLFVGHLL